MTEQTTVPRADSPREITGRARWLILGALLLGMLLAALDQTIVSTALPTIVADLGGLRAPHVGRHRLSARVDRLDAAVGQARRPLRSQDLLPGGDRHLPHRVGARRAQPEHGAAHRLPGHSGARRRRAHGRRAVHHRGRHPAPGTWPLSGTLRRRLRGDERHRPAHRRAVRRPSQLALGVLHQRAGGSGRARGRRRRAARDRAAGPAADRLPRHAHCWRGRPWASSS